MNLDLHDNALPSPLLFLSFFLPSSPLLLTSSSVSACIHSIEISTSVFSNVLNDVFYCFILIDFCNSSVLYAPCCRFSSLSARERGYTLNTLSLLHSIPWLYHICALPSSLNFYFPFSRFLIVFSVYFSTLLFILSLLPPLSPPLLLLFSLSPSLLTFVDCSGDSNHRENGQVKK